MTLPRVLATFMMAIAAVFGLSAQNSLPAPGTGGSYHPSPIGGGGGWGGGFGRRGELPSAATIIVGRCM